MKISINLFPFTSFPMLWLPCYSFEESIKRVAAIGYDAVEVVAAVPHAWPPYLDDARRKEMRQCLSDHGLEASSVAPALGGGAGYNPASKLNAEQHQSIRHYKDCVDLAVSLGAPLVTFCAGWRMYGQSMTEAWDTVRTSLTEIAEYAKDRNIVIAIEPAADGTNVVEHDEHAIQLKKEIGLENIKLMIDTAHIQYRGEQAADYVRRMGGDLVHTHITDFDRAIPGTNGYDFVPVLNAMKEVGYTGYWCIEAGFTQRNLQPESVARTALEHFRSLVNG